MGARGHCGQLEHQRGDRIRLRRAWGSYEDIWCTTRIDPAEEAREAIKEAVEVLVADGAVVLDVEATAMECETADMAVEDTADDGGVAAINEEYEKMMAEIKDTGL
ncbi:hypothetical protein B0A48_00372 [Cryoendolithus antarcticus]|uniref:Uncharacterized protein n=1 Tax=Cryoendolithus antarcticus TaxID=1507870 RepID=A0A1V8TUC2_9PEZI|nr:hypothetical protein B0A48_00372 [Cryoendolithus antarcticus]